MSEKEQSGVSWTIVFAVLLLAGVYFVVDAVKDSRRMDQPSVPVEKQDDKGRCVINENGQIICLVKENKDGLLQVFGKRQRGRIQIGDEPNGSEPIGDSK